MGNCQTKNIHNHFSSTWPVPSKPPENQLLPKLPKKLLPERQPGKLPLPGLESRNLIGSDQVPLLSERSEDIKRQPISSSGSFLSRDSSERLPVTSTKNLDSKVQPSLLFERLLKLILLVFSKIPISVLSMLKELPSCPGISNSPEESEVKDFD